MTPSISALRIDRNFRPYCCRKSSQFATEIAQIERSPTAQTDPIASTTLLLDCGTRPFQTIVSPPSTPRKKSLDPL